MGALPSVTGILNLLAKPGLVKWQVEQGIKAVLSLVDDMDSVLDPMFDDASRPQFIAQMVKKSEEYTNWTADFGTAVHWWVNKKLRAAETNELPPIIPGAEEVADGVLAYLESHGYELALTEHRFARPDLGYAGTVDMVGTHGNNPCIVDLKTQEPPLIPYLEHALQLAGYDYAITEKQNTCLCGHHISAHAAQPASYNCMYCSNNGHDCSGLDIPARERISLIANRLNPGEVKEHVWIDKNSTVEATNARYDKIWLGLVDLWMGLNQYDPRQLEGAN